MSLRLRQSDGGDSLAGEYGPESCCSSTLLHFPSAHASDRSPVSLPPAPEPHLLYDVSKRSLDVVLGLLLLIASAPFIVAAAATVAIFYRTNPFYVQRRLGKGGREFPMLKIKSMRDGADSSIPEHLNETGGPTFKSSNDPRVSRLGRLLRMTSLDEMPQFLNVVLGQMAIVGPRPPLAREVIHYSRPQLERLRVKPGLTCIWQVSGRSDIGFRRWMAADRVYVRRRSLWFDLGLLLRTPWAVITMRGAR